MKPSAFRQTVLIIFVLILSFMTAGNASAGDCVTVEGRGEVVLSSFTPEEAKVMAIRNARHNAIEQVAGVKISGTTIVKDMSLVGDFVKSMSRGYVRKEKVIRWEQDTYQPTKDVYPVNTQRVVIEACVSEPPKSAGQEITVRASLNKNHFLEGEKPVLQIATTKTAYVHLFNLTADDKVIYYHRLVPQIRMPIKIEGGETLTFPPKGISLPVMLPENYKRGMEAFIVVAVFDDSDLSVLFPVKKEMSIAEFHEGLLSIKGSMAEEMAMYVIEKK